MTILYITNEKVVMFICLQYPNLHWVLLDFHLDLRVDILHFHMRIEEVLLPLILHSYYMFR